MGLDQLWGYQYECRFQTYWRVSIKHKQNHKHGSFHHFTSIACKPAVYGYCGKPNTMKIIPLCRNRCWTTLLTLSCWVMTTLFASAEICPNSINSHQITKLKWGHQAVMLFWSLYWLVVYLPLRKMMDFVSWDDDIPNWMESHIKFHGSKAPSSIPVGITIPINIPFNHLYTT